MHLLRLLPLLALTLALRNLPAQTDTLIDAQTATALSTEGRQTLYRFMQQMPDGTEAGLAILDGDSTVYYGVRREGGMLGTVDNADSRFGIGSVSKVFTASLLAALVEEGALALDDTVNYAYDFPFADGIAFTYRQLATHTSGLPRLPNNMPGMLLGPQNPYAGYDGPQLETYLQKNLSVAPDGNGGYSNLGFGLLGYTLGSRIDTGGYAAALQSRVLDPIGLPATSFGKDSTRGPVIPGFDEDGRPASYWDFTEAMGAAGAIVSTPRDMATFLRAQLDSTRTVLALTREEQVTLSPQQGVGLGWQILHPTPEYTVHWHNGAVGGYRAFAAIDTQRERGIVLLVNVLRTDNLVDQTAMSFLRPKN